MASRVKELGSILHRKIFLLPSPSNDDHCCNLLTRPWLAVTVMVTVTEPESWSWCNWPDAPTLSVTVNLVCAHSDRAVRLAKQTPGQGQDSDAVTEPVGQGHWWSPAIGSLILPMSRGPAPVCPGGASRVLLARATQLVTATLPALAPSPWHCPHLRLDLAWWFLGLFTVWPYHRISYVNIWYLSLTCDIICQTITMIMTILYIIFMISEHIFLYHRNMISYVSTMTWWPYVDTMIS